MPARSVLILAELGDQPRAVLESACVDAGFSTTWAATVEAASGQLSSGAFDGLLLDLSTPGAAHLCLRARGKLTKGRFPIIALTDSVDDTTFERAFRAGADDAVQLTEGALLSRRLKGLPQANALRAGRPRGEALIADPDRARAELLERVLADAGYKVEVVRDELAAKLHFGRPNVRLVVLDPSVGDLSALFQQSRKKGARSVWIVRARPEAHSDILRSFGPKDPVSVVNAFGPPDDVLFESNRLLDESQKDARAEPRTLYSTMVTFSAADGTMEDHGFSYNISASGLYVRTLAPPSGDEVQVRLRGPVSGSGLAFGARIVWRRGFGPTQKESAPPGFGVQLVSGDLNEWADCFRRLEAERQGMSTAQPTEPRDGPPPARRDQPGPPSSSRRAAIEAFKKTMAGIAPTPARPPLPRRNLAKTAVGLAPPETPSVDGTASAEADAEGAGREPPQSSVSDMLSDALSDKAPESRMPGSVPLTIAGDFKQEGAAVVASRDSGATSDPAKPASLHPDALTSEPPEVAEADAAGSEDLSRWSETELPNAASIETSTATESTSGRAADPLGKTVALAEVDGVTIAGADENEASAAVGTTQDESRSHLESANTEPPAAVVAAEENFTAPDNAVPDADTGDENTSDRRESDGGSPASFDAVPLKRPNRVATWAAIVAIAAGITGGGIFALRRSHGEASKKTETREPVIASAAVTNTAVENEAPAPTTEPIAAKNEAAENEAPAPTTEPASPEPAAPRAVEDPSLAPTTEPAARAPTAASDEGEEAGIEIPPGMAALRVESPLDANVYVHGKLVGRTNQTVVSHCGVRFVRLGNAPGDWVSDGIPMKIKCEQLNRVALP